MGKSVLVTGGSRGLGRATALALAAQGHDVVLTWHREEAAAEAVAAEIRQMGRRAATMRLDVREADGFDDFATRLAARLRTDFGQDRLDAVVHNAGTGQHAPYAETTMEAFDALVAVHLRAPFFLTQALLGLLADGGRIVHLSSGLTRFSLPGYAAYAAVKGAVEVLTRYQAKELGHRGIRVNTIAPGAIETDFGGGAVRDDRTLNAYVASQTALGRAGLPGDVGGAIAALLSEGTGWVNGQRIEVSGGMFL